jgi:hypothetical protein
VSIGYDPGAPNGWGYVNRSQIIDAEMILDIVCWNECLECQGQSSVIQSGLNTMVVYPNPSTGVVHIKSEEPLNRFDIYSVLGELVYSEVPAVNKHEISINVQKNGLYYISLYTQKGIINKKITIQK